MSNVCAVQMVFFFSSRRRHTRLQGDWSSDVCSSDLRAVHFELEKTLAVDPHLPNLAVLARHLELIGGVALDLVGAGQLHLGALARVEIGRASCRERV